MRIRFAVVLLIASAAAALLYRSSAESQHNAPSQVVPGQLVPQVGRASAFGISDDVTSIAKPPTKPRPKDASEIPVKETYEQDGKKRVEYRDGVHDQDAALATFIAAPMPTPAISRDGLSNFDNIDLYNLMILPPDPIGDVGPAHYVQIVNSAVRVFDKEGNALLPAFKLSSLFSSLNTVCSARNDGDGIVVYDQLADRWILSQFCTAFPPFRQMMAVSKTGDPTGQYYVYEFVMPNVRLNDYSKFGVWPDAYYMSTDEFLGSDYVGSGMFAFDRERLLAGSPVATFIYFNTSLPPSERVGGLIPADLDGLKAPPTGMPNIFVGYTANEYGDATDAIRLFNFRVDFDIPMNSTFIERPESPIPVPAFDPTSSPGRMDIRQPPPGEFLDALSDRLMYRVAYRNLGDRESLVFNQTVRISQAAAAYRAGVRVYELQRAQTPGFALSVGSTIGEPLTSKWNGSAAQDNKGNLAVSYNVVSDEREPGLFYTGRLATDPAGVFRNEGELIAGTGVQKAFGFRWGDYSGMSVDPTDDCTFWMTGEYYTQESEEYSPFTWLTRFGKFKFAECTPAAKATIRGTITDAQSGLAVQIATISSAAYSRATDSVGRYDLAVIPGDHLLTVSARGYRTQTISVSAAAGQTIIRDVALQPVPIIENTALAIVSESCDINGAAEPGESVTVNVSMRNSGLLTANSLTGTLQRSGGVIEPGPAQNYGNLPPNGASVARPFTFTVSPGIACGRVITLSFDIQSGGEPVGTLQIPLGTGRLRYALQESVAGPRFPSEWTTSATGAGQPWSFSTRRFVSVRGSLFSPAPNQIGLNELISPAVPISSREARLSFQNWYELETTFLRNRLYDGSVLEISLDGGQWQDIIAAGGTFESGGYDGVIDACCQNPLAGRMGWSGRSGINQTSEFITSSVRLPSAAVGRTARFRWRIGTDIGTFREGQYLDNIDVTDGHACTCAVAAMNRVLFDFDGDASTDLSVFRPSDEPGAADFIIQNSANETVTSMSWGSIGDVAANADFDGDRRTDLVVYRPSNGVWYIMRSLDLTFAAVQFGLAGDRPFPSDHDGDGRSDIAVFRPSEGTWYQIASSNGQINVRQFGVAEDIPVPGDYDGDGRSDIAVYRPGAGQWFIARSSDASIAIVPFGQQGDRPVAGDFDGDGQTDLVVFRPSSGVWYLLRSKLGFGAVQFGQAGDAPLQADFDSDGQNDIAVFRPGAAVWYYVRSLDNAIVTRAFGSPGDKAIPSVYVSD